MAFTPHQKFAYENPVPVNQQPTAKHYWWQATDKLGVQASLGMTASCDRETFDGHPFWIASTSLRRFAEDPKSQQAVIPLSVPGVAAYLTSLAIQQLNGIGIEEADAHLIARSDSLIVVYRKMTIEEINGLNEKWSSILLAEDNGWRKQYGGTDETLS